MESIDYRPSPEEIEALRKEEKTRHELNIVFGLKNGAIRKSLKLWCFENWDTNGKRLFKEYILAENPIDIGEIPYASNKVVKWKCSHCGNIWEYLKKNKCKNKKF